MVFEVVRGYVQLASGLGELTRARATEVAQGLLSLPAAGVATGGQVAVQVGALAEELLAAALTNRQNLAALVRGEVDAAVTRLGLVPAEKLEESQAEAARLRAEVARLRSSSKAAAGTSGPKGTAPKRTAATKTSAKATVAKAPAKKATAKKATAKKATAKKATAKKATAAEATAAEATAAKPTAVKASEKKATAVKDTATITPATSAAANPTSVTPRPLPAGS
jgi:hypothetical protein